MKGANSTLQGRTLRREEIERVWTLDRSELIENTYTLRNGNLELKPQRFDITGWPPGEAEKYTPILIECFDRGGWCYGLFDGESLMAVAVLDAKFIGPRHDRLQLKFLHVSKSCRGQRLGKRLFELAKVEARKRGANRLYISATASEHTINFYLRSGSVLAGEVDPELFSLEPDDIHLECSV